MAKKQETQEVVEEDQPLQVFITIDTEGQYWWATRDEKGDLTESDGAYADLDFAKDRARVVLERDDLLFTVEEDDRGAMEGETV